MEPRKPDFIIIGSAKCGTTALASILGAHPDCCMSNPKEVKFFHDDASYEKGWGWYQRAFAHYNGEPVVGEASPQYASRGPCPHTAKRIHEFNPDMKIIFMVRHPLERELSFWKMVWDLGIRGEDGISEKSALNGFDHWMRMVRDLEWWDDCRYHYQLEAYLKCFPTGQILVSFLEDWKLGKDGEVARIMRFLGLDPAMQAAGFQERANRAVDRTMDRPLLKKIRLHPLARIVVGGFPASWRDWARNKIARTKVVPPTPDLSMELKAEFINHVKPDAEIFLKQWGKPFNYWDLK